MLKSGITKRWILTTLLVITVILIRRDRKKAAQAKA